MYISFHVKYSLFLSDFNNAWMFLTDFWKILEYQIFMKTYPVGAELSHVDGQTDRRYKPNSRFL